MARSVKVAAVQMPFGDRVGGNLRTMAAAVVRMARRGVRLAVFPECCLSGYLVPPKKRIWMSIASGIAWTQELAAAHRMAIVFGTAWPNGRKAPFNSAVAVDERGRLASRYDKLHLYGEDLKCFSPGRRLPEVFRLAGIRVAMQVCFDVRFPEPARAAALRGAKLITYSFAGTGKGAWKLPVIEGHLRSRAAENGVFVVGANRAHRVMIVESRIVGPDGQDVAAPVRVGRAGETVAAIVPAKARREFLRLRRPGIYKL